MYQITNIYVLAAFGTIGGALFGFDISSMSAWIGVDSYLTYFNHPDSDLQGSITASMSAGSFAGALAAGFISDHLGRRISLQIACVIWIVGAMVQCSAQNVAHLIAGRVVSGLAVGITSSQVWVYLAELAPAKIRGRVVGLQQWSIEWGILIMYLIPYGCSFVTGPAGFRITWGLQAVPGLVLLVALFFFPESPRWLATTERWEECRDGDADTEAVRFEFEEVKEAARVAAEAKNVSFLDLFKPKVVKRTIAGVTVQMWQQLLGGNVSMYYVVYLAQMSGLTGNTSLYTSIIQYVIFLVTTGGILPFIDRLGRRPLLIDGALICSAIHFTIAAVMSSKGHYVDSVDGNTNLRWKLTGAPGKAVIACSYIFVGVYGLIWAPCGWIYASEVFPLTLRAKGVGLSAATNWAFNFAIAYLVAPAFTNIQWRTYIIFGVFCAVMAVHTFTYPETAQKSLEEIDYIFNSNVRPWRSAKVTGFEERLDEQRGSIGGSTIAPMERKNEKVDHAEQV